MPNVPEQEMMLGVPPGVEPAPDTEVAAKERMPRSRAIVQVDIAGVSHTVAMRAGMLTVRRKGKRHVDSKSVQDVAHFVMGQGDLFNTLNTKPDEAVVSAMKNLIEVMEDPTSTEAEVAMMIASAKQAL